MPIIQQLKSGSFLISIPRALARAKGWDKGTEVSLVLNNRGNIEILEKKDSGHARE
jgi:hypothetical protein